MKIRKYAPGLMLCFIIGFGLSWLILDDSVIKSLAFGLAMSGIYIVSALVPASPKIQAEVERMKNISSKDTKR